MLVKQTHLYENDKINDKQNSKTMRKETRKLFGNELGLQKLLEKGENK